MIINSKLMTSDDEGETDGTFIALVLCWHKLQEPFQQNFNLYFNLHQTSV